MSDWMEKAACRDGDPEWFFPIARTGTRAYAAEVSLAKDVCESCPVAERCLDLAMRVELGLAASARFGVFGGLAPEERYELDEVAKEGRARGRPRVGSDEPCGFAYHPAKAVKRHEERGEEPCVACAGYLGRKAEREAMYARMDALIEKGLSDYAIEMVGFHCKRETIRSRRAALAAKAAA